MRRLWQLCPEWPKGSSVTLELPGLSRQYRLYIHRWCTCWVGIDHVSSGEGDERVLVLTRGPVVCRRQMRDEENHPDDAPVNPDESNGESTGASTGDEAPASGAAAAASTPDEAAPAPSPADEQPPPPMPAEEQPRLSVRKRPAAKSTARQFQLPSQFAQ